MLYQIANNLNELNLRVQREGRITVSDDLKQRGAPMALLATLLAAGSSFAGLATAALAILSSKKSRKLGRAGLAEQSLNRFGFCCALLSVGLLIGVIILAHFF